MIWFGYYFSKDSKDLFLFLLNMFSISLSLSLLDGFVSFINFSQKFWIFLFWLRAKFRWAKNKTHKKAIFFWNFLLIRLLIDLQQVRTKMDQQQKKRRERELFKLLKCCRAFKRIIYRLLCMFAWNDVKQKRMPYLKITRKAQKMHG